jgi:hypothetical protein
MFEIWKNLKENCWCEMMIYIPWKLYKTVVLSINQYFDVSLRKIGKYKKGAERYFKKQNSDTSLKSHHLKKYWGKVSSIKRGWWWVLWQDVWRDTCGGIWDYEEDLKDEENNHEPAVVNEKPVETKNESFNNKIVLWIPQRILQNHRQGNLLKRLTLQSRIRRIELQRK